ncbi:MAG TPA: efflux RND transporter periplasmic adaptor subunit [Polyangiaceae bacterium]
MKRPFPVAVWSAALLTLPLATSSCESKRAVASAPARPVEVGVVTLKTEPVTLTTELPGRTSAYRVAEVRARVNGIVQKRLFTEGSDVKEGARLFLIDPAPYQASFESARAMRMRAEATVAAASAKAERYGKLIQHHAVSQQEYDEAVAAAKGAEADVAAGRAAEKTARINLQFTNVTAPLSGRIGRAEVTEGAYVQQSTATLLATIQQLDPMYVDLTWSTSDALRLRRQLESGKLKNKDGETNVKLLLEDGRDYGVPGTMQFAGVTVDPTTGSITLRALFPNPRRELLPGMFVRARLEEGTVSDGLLVPQRGVTRNQTGQATALVVNAQNKVERRQFQTARAVGDAWLVNEGFKPGDRVIVEGLQKVRPGATVVPTAAKAPPGKNPAGR